MGAAQVGELAGAHGSALVEAGAGQALAAVTVGSPFERQEVESLLGVERQHLFVHTAQPAFAQNRVMPLPWSPRPFPAVAQLPDLGSIILSTLACNPLCCYCEGGENNGPKPQRCALLVHE